MQLSFGSGAVWGERTDVIGSGIVGRVGCRCRDSGGLELRHCKLASSGRRSKKDIGMLPMPRATTTISAWSTRVAENASIG